MPDKKFYSDITAFNDFNGILDPDNYQDIPADWYIVIADIKGSTKAVTDGKYKEVNTVGASCIIAVLNALGKDNEIPYVFGGDGASFAIPPGVLEPVAKALLGTRLMAQEQFDLNLRVGAVPVTGACQNGHKLQVAKYQLSEHITIAMFQGGALGCADQLIKREENKYDIQNYYSGESNADFDGLECRWNPIKSHKGNILTLIVQTASNSQLETYNALLEKIGDIYGDKSNYRPNHQTDMSLSLNPKKLRQEYAIQTHNLPYLKRISYAFKLALEAILGTIFFTFDVQAMGVEGRKYITDLVANTDFQKFDDALRMVIDSNQQQTMALNKYLEEEFNAGNLYYGLHLASEALMTCLIFNRVGAHLHFIDGSSGGYAMAASSMKKQIRK